MWVRILVTIRFSTIVSSAGRGYAFEPPAKFRERLIDHIQRNRCADVEVVKEGLSDKKENLKLYVGGDSVSLYHWDSDITKTAWEKVRLVTFDGFVDKMKLRRLDFLKADIDGNEMCFLMGSRKSLRKMKPMILIECNQMALQNAESDVSELVTHLRGLRYELCSEKTGFAFANDDELYPEAKN